jgi:hypothetical protein
VTGDVRGGVDRAEPGTGIRLIQRVDELSAAQWGSLATHGNPFLSYGFLSALERQRCLGQRVGWFPRHLTLWNGGGGLLGAMPMYLKANSFGEFVFDWSWAQAHERGGLSYYPKAVVCAPFTPATGPRLLVAESADRESVAGTLIEAAIRVAEHNRLSSVHWLFGCDPELRSFPGLMSRKGCQFHWENRGYRDFDDFLDALTSKRRKEIRRERRQAQDARLEIRRIAGDEASDADWELFHRLYRRTFLKHGNFAALTRDFFVTVARSLGKQVLLVVAGDGHRAIAGALFFCGPETLYGRYWGAFDEVPALHFELCYYQGIEYCIEQGLTRFEPGAQGEHKVSRGFDPRATWSYHWIADSAMRAAIGRFLQQEAAEVDAYMRQVQSHSAYRMED